MEHIRVKGDLTPRFINNRLNPFLDALTGIQNTIDEIKGKPSSPVRIHEISWEDSTDDKDFSVEQPSNVVSLDAAKQALSGLREALDALYEQPKNSIFQRAKARTARKYANFIYDTLLHQYSEHESEIYDIEGRSGSPILHSNRVVSVHVNLDALDELSLSSLDDKKREINHIIGLLKGEEHD